MFRLLTNFVPHRQVLAAVILCCMPWLGDLEHEELLIRFSSAIASWPSPIKQVYTLYMSGTGGTASCQSFSCAFIFTLTT